MHGRSVDWANFYSNYSKSDGLEGVDQTDLSIFRKQMIASWSRLAQKRGFEVAVISLQDPKLFEILLPELSSWDELVDRLDRRVCSEYLTLGLAIKWFIIVQAFLGLMFLFPCLWPIVSKYFVCRTIRKGKNCFLYINRRPEFGGEFPILDEDLQSAPADIDGSKSEEQDQDFIASYVMFHVRSDTVDWLPDKIKSKVKKESKEVKKLRRYEDQASRRRQERSQEKLLGRQSSGLFDRLKTWCAETFVFPRAETADDRKIEARRRKNLRRTYSAIPADEYEKEELINLHLLPPSLQPSTSRVKETTSLFNIR